jgi:hypothetical protein
MRRAMTNATGAPDPIARTALRCALFAAAFVASAALVFALARQAIDAARIEPVGLALNLAVNAQRFERDMLRDRGSERIALVGDSTMMTMQGMSAPSRQVLPARVSAALRQHGARGHDATLHTLCVPGLGPSGVYFISDRIIAAHPDRVAISLSLSSFSRQALREFGYAEIAGFLAARELPRMLRTSLFDVGLTLDRVLFYQAIVAARAVDAWRALRGMQARAFKLRDRLSSALDDRLGSRAYADMQFALGIARLTRAQLPGKPRATRAMAQAMFGPALEGLSADDPGLRMLDAALLRLQRAHIPALVYLRPNNVQHLAALGLSLDRLPDTVATIRRSVERRGARLADFHALFPDAAFTDSGDHYTFEGDPNGTNWLGDRIAFELMQSAPSTYAAGASHAVQ